MILKTCELIELTRRVKWYAQARELDAMGIPYRRRSDGSLVVFVEDLHHASAQKGQASPKLRFS
jgi:hypothetical protein